MTCQITYIPLFTEDVIDEVQAFIDHFEEYEVEVEVNDVSSVIKGEKSEVFRLIEDSYDRVDESGRKFRLHVELLNTNGYS